MEEIWKDIEGYEGLYQVSNLGRVRSLDRIIPSKLKNNNFVKKKGKIIQLRKKKDGYVQVKLKKDGSQKLMSVHRLVAKAFIDNPNNYEIVNHKDNNPENNNEKNLEWCTQSYNIKYSYNQKRSKSPKYWKGKLGINHCRAKQVNQYDLNFKYINTYGSIGEAERITGISHGNIISCCKGNYKTAGGYIWRYKEEQ